MLRTDMIAEFILTLITKANDEDIETFLEYSVKFYPDMMDFLPAEPYKYKTLLIRILFFYIYGYIEKNVHEIVDVVSRWDDWILQEFNDFQNNLSKYESLYLHLYALCQCYYSYILINPKGKIFNQMFVDAYSKYFEKDMPKINTVKDNTHAKLIKLFINSYKENGFYYFFYRDTLVKLTIHNYKKYNEERKVFFPSATYKHTKYKLEDKGNATYIVGKKTNKSLGDILIRMENINSNDLEGFFNNFAKSYSYSQVKSFHNKIVAALKKDNSDDTILCNEKNVVKLQKKCIILIEKLKELQSLIIEDEPEKDILDFKHTNFEEKLFNDYKYKTLKELKDTNKTIVEKAISKLAAAIEKAEDDYTYGRLKDTVKGIIPIISDCFES